VAKKIPTCKTFNVTKGREDFGAQKRLVRCRALRLGPCMSYACNHVSLLVPKPFCLANSLSRRITRSKIDPSYSPYLSDGRASGVPVILGVEPNGDHRVLLEGDSATQYQWVIPSPDGRYAVLEVVTGANNVWMVENF